MKKICMKSLGKIKRKYVKLVKWTNFVTIVKKILAKCHIASLVSDMCVWIARWKDIVQFVNKVFANIMKNQ